MGSRVILADDSVTIQKVVGIIFANEGYELTVVASGDEAIAKARAIKPDVMLIDALMPGKNGYEVCREIRQDPALAHTAILLMTGAFEVVDEEKNRQSGADDFITKPFESQALIDITNRLIALTAERAGKPAGIAVPAPAAAPPAAPPAAPAPVAAPPVAPAAPVAAPSVDDIWATGFDDEPAAAPVVAAVAQAAAPAAPAPAGTNDALWDAFDMGEMETAPAPVAAPVAPVAVSAADDVFSFEAETPSVAPAPANDEFVLDEVVFDEPSAAALPQASGFEPFGEKEISFASVEPTPAVPPVAAPQIDDEFGAISFDEPETPPAAATLPPVDEDFGTISFDEPAAPAIAVAAAPPVMPMAPPTPAAAPQQPPAVTAPAPAAPGAAVVGPLDEEQLTALLSKVSREVIERIVWEVVPDLAETIIKEEIRKLKAGIA